MSPEMSSSIVGALIALLGAFLVTIIAPKLQRTKKIIEISTNSLQLQRFKPLLGTLKMSIDKFLVTSDEKDKGTSYEINNIYGFEITLFNVGNEHIESPNIEIHLDTSAKIVGYETQPVTKPGYEITLQRDNTYQNILRIQLPFLNKNKPVVIRLISTENANTNCEIEIIGPDIHTRNRRAILALNLITFFLFFLPIIIITIINNMPKSIVLLLGGSYIQNMVPLYPVYFTILEFILLGSCFMIALVLTLLSKRDIEWNDTKRSLLQRIFDN